MTTTPETTAVRASGSATATLVGDSSADDVVRDDSDRQWQRRAVGRFVLLQRLGSGGMGVVYLAYDPELDRKVALKLVRVASSLDEARVLREAQALAQLNHPNVVTIHDVGRFESGVYIAMEHVEGGSVRAWLRGRQPSWRQIVAVFCAAGRGLAAAHDAGLVHRDVKPDNLMMGRDGRVRVVDFGLAKPTEEGPPTSARSLDLSLTEAGGIQGTPLYMAPEQFRGGTIDARSDVYSLSISLWEALHGERAFEADSLAELSCAVLEGRVRIPSRRVGPRWLARVVRRGIAIDPRDRWNDMNALVAALNNDPFRTPRRVAVAFAITGGVAGLAWGRDAAPCAGVEASLAPVWNEQRMQVIAAAFDATGQPFSDEGKSASLDVLDGYANALIAGRRDACEATRIHGTASDAVFERRSLCLDRRVRALDELARLLEGGDALALEHAVEAGLALPEVEACADIEVLSRAPAPSVDLAVRARVEQTRSQLAAIEAALHVGAAEQAEPELRVLESEARSVGDPWLLAEVALMRGRWATMYASSNDTIVEYQAALALATEQAHDAVIVDSTLALVREEAGRNHFDAAEVYRDLASATLNRLGRDPVRRIELARAIGVLETARHRPGAAIEALDAALALALATPTASEIHMAPLQQARARALTLEGRLDEALLALDQAQQILERQRGATHPSLATIALLRAQIFQKQRRFADALSLAELAQQLLRNSAADDRQALGAALNDEGRALSSLGRLPEARDAYQRGLDLAVRAFGERHLNVAGGLGNVAAIDLRLGRPEAAIEPLERALSIRRSLLGDTHDLVAKTLDLLGDAHLGMGELDRAASLYGEAIAIFERMGGARDTRLAYPLAGRAKVAERRGDPAAALVDLERAAALLGQETAPQTRGDVLFGLARVLPISEVARKRGLLDEAEQAYGGDAEAVSRVESMRASLR